MKSPKESWGTLLNKNIGNYSLGRPKRGMFIHNYIINLQIDNTINSCLEEGAFSAKDTLYLKEHFPAWRFITTDIEPEVVSYSKSQGLESTLADAFKLPFTNESIDVTFHSGLIILFNNDDTLKIIKEQMRITSKIAFIFAHNRSNLIDRLGSFFKRYILRKKIYTFRRFSKKELKSFLAETGLQGEIYHYDNALENFISRHLPKAVVLLKFLGLQNPILLSNELVLIIRK